MAKQKVSENFCKLKSINVTVLEDKTEDLGRTSIIKWRIVKCLDQNSECNSLDCKYVVKGLSDYGSQNPF